MSLNGRVVAFFHDRERAVRFADLVARCHHQFDGQSVAVSLHDGEEAVDIILHGEEDPAANALAWIRNVSALRGARGAARRAFDSPRRLA